MVIDREEADTPSFDEAYNRAQSRTGRQPLSDTDLLILSCAEVRRSYTRDEKNYA